MNTTHHTDIFTHLGFLWIDVEWRGRMLNCIYTFDCLIKCAFLEFNIKVKGMVERQQLPTFAMSLTTTTSNLSPYPSDLKYSIIKFPLSLVRTVPRTSKPLSRRVRTIHIAIYPLAPETNTLDPLFTGGIAFEWAQSYEITTLKADARYPTSDESANPRSYKSP